MNEKKEGTLIYKNHAMSEAENKDAILLLAFGTTFPQARKLSIDSVAEDIKAAYPDKHVMLSFSSKIVVKRIKENEGITYLSPSEALDELQKEGYTRVTMISMDFMPGHEYDLKREAFEAKKENFKWLALSRPLMYWTGEENRPDDLLILYQAIQECFPPREPNSAVLLMGHGSDHSANSYYKLLQQRINALANDNVFVYTVEGDPLLEDVIVRLKKRKFQKVMLVPLMIVAGDHAMNDMNSREPGAHRRTLEDDGFEVDAYLHGAGENKAVRQIFLERCKELWEQADK